MPSFQAGPNYRTPFGRNVYLRSTQDIKTTSYTVARSTVPARTIDGHAGQKVLQPGTVLAKITSGPDSGKIGPHNLAATDGRQTVTNIVGLCNTFLPWQLQERDVEVAVVYEATAVQAWCFQYTNDTTITAVTDTTANAMRGGKSLHILFH
jgi:hypothetical protein